MSSPFPNLSAARAKFVIGLVWFFKNISEIITIIIAGTVIHSANILAEVLVTRSLGTKNLKYPSSYFILKSTSSL